MFSEAILNWNYDIRYSRVVGGGPLRTQTFMQNSEMKNNYAEVDGVWGFEEVRTFRSEKECRSARTHCFIDKEHYNALQSQNKRRKPTVIIS